MLMMNGSKSLLLMLMALGYLVVLVAFLSRFWFETINQFAVTVTIGLAHISLVEVVDDVKSSQL